MQQLFAVFTKTIPIEPKMSYAAKAVSKGFEEIQNCGGTSSDHIVQSQMGSAPEAFPRMGQAGF